VKRLLPAYAILLAAALAAGLAGCGGPAVPPSTPLPATKIAQPAEQDDDDGTLIDDAWQASFWNGAKLGNGHVVIRKVPSPHGEVVRTTSTQRLRIQRFGQTTQETLDLSSIDTPAGQPLAFRCRAAAMGLEATGEFGGGMLKITTETKGKTSLTTIPWDDDTLGYFGLEDSLRRQPLQPGEKRRVKWLQPLLHLVTEEQLEAEQEEDVDLLGETKRLLRIKSDAKMAGQTVHRTLWTDTQGRVWKMINPRWARRTTARARWSPSGTPARRLIWDWRRS